MSADLKSKFYGFINFIFSVKDTFLDFFDSSISTLSSVIGKAISKFNFFENKKKFIPKIKRKRNKQGFSSEIEDILERHHVDLPQNADNQKLIPLIKKLHTTLIYAHGTLTIGSTNKISGLKKMCSQTSKYVSKMRENKDEYDYWACHANNNTDWIEHPLFENNNINNIVSFVSLAIRAEKYRIGNCAELCAIATDYLWRFPGKEIERIEPVSAQDFDHVWLILNRKQGSNLLKPNEWGKNCWILDPWWKNEGVFYSAEKYHEKVLELLPYMIKQYEWRENKGVTGLPLASCRDVLNRYKDAFQKGSLSVPITLKDNICFDINATPYPFECNVKIGQYYEYMPDNARASHQENFRSCLEEIRTCNGTPKKKTIKTS